MTSPSTYIHKEIPSETERVANAFDELTYAFVEHRTAIVSLLNLIEELEASGLLSNLSALLKAREEVLGVALQQLTKPGAKNAIQNILSLVETLQRVDGEHVQSVLTALTQGLDAGHQHLNSNPEVGIFDLVRALRDPSVSRSMSLILGALKGFGEAVG